MTGAMFLGENWSIHIYSIHGAYDNLEYLGNTTFFWGLCCFIYPDLQDKPDQESIRPWGLLLDVSF